MDIKGALTRPLGPLPAWAWGVIIAGGYLLYRYLHTGSFFGSNSSATGNEAAAIIPASDYGGGGGGAVGSGGTTTTTTDTTTTTGITPVVTNTASAISQLPSDVASYYAAKGGSMGFSGSVTYDPATNLARWLQIQSQGISGTAFTPQDVQIGVASATDAANAAGVTQTQLATAQQGINGPLGVWYGISQTSQQPQLEALSNSGMLGKEFTTAQISYINAQGGWTPENITAAAKAGPNPPTNPTVTTSTQQVPSTTVNIAAQTPLTQKQRIAAAGLS